MWKLLDIQCALKAPKNQKNNFWNYKYRSCEDILEAVKPLLALHKCTLTISDELVNIWERYYIKATVTIRDNDQTTTNRDEPFSVCWYAREEEVKKGMDSSQITWAASSYARKYALNWMFLIDDTKDSDATNTYDKTAATTTPIAIEPEFVPSENCSLLLEQVKKVGTLTWLATVASQISAAKIKSELTEAEVKLLQQTYNLRYQELSKPTWK